MPTSMANAMIPREVEAVPTTLARIEGTVNRVADRVDGLMSRMDRTETAVAILQALTQRLDLDATARDKTAVALALALKDAELERRTKDTATWSPFQKTATVVIAIVGMGTLYLQTRGILP